MKIKAVVTFMASSEVEVEVPDGLTGLDLADAVQASLEANLPEVVQGCEFMHPVEGSIETPEGKQFGFELGKNAG